MQDPSPEERLLGAGWCWGVSTPGLKRLSLETRTVNKKMHPPNCKTEQGQVPGKTCEWDSRQGLRQPLGWEGEAETAPGGLLPGCPGHETAQQHARGTEPNGPAFPRERAKWRRHKAVPFLFALPPPYSNTQIPLPRGPHASSSSVRGYEAGETATADSWGSGDRSRGFGWVGAVLSSDFARPALQSDVQAQDCPWAL